MKSTTRLLLWSGDQNIYIYMYIYLNLTSLEVQKPQGAFECAFQAPWHHSHDHDHDHRLGHDAQLSKEYTMR